ncbi:MAG TPA: sigma-54 dependent transcriptional regulator [Bacteroidales bacterium]|nr:sigma-54 dependent transcriptional regulator [Bacteroidales bacterium]
MEGTILIVDDNKAVTDSLSLFLKRKVNKVITANTPQKIPEILQNNYIDIIILDMNFESTENLGEEGIYWLKKIKSQNPEQVVIMITAYGDVELAVEALQKGASNFILKPWDNQKLLATITNALELSKSRREVSILKSEQNQLKRTFNSKFQNILGHSPAIHEVFKIIEKVAPTEANVIILGENGTGKELVAREIHRQSLRKENIFMPIDMGTITESIFESELFGYKKGAFTDAKEDKPGRLILANGGTLFLDEIGNLSQAMQAKLLTVIQNKEVTPVGGAKPLPIDVRIICATNQNIHEMVTNSMFREDLLYRINTIQIDLPPLRLRGDDIILIANYYLQKHAEKYGKKNLTFSDSSINQLMEYHWPGNIRELSHTVERAVIMCEEKIITPGDLFLKKHDDSINLIEKPLRLNEAEKIVIASSIKRNNGNISAVSKELGIGRQTLYRKIKEYGIS